MNTKNNMGFMILFLSVAVMNGCANRHQNTLLGLGVAGQMPINEIEQTYYLGVFDPKEQIPPQVYRVRVHGQSSFGGGQFSSGWVPAEVIDTLNLSETQNDQKSIGLGQQGKSFLKGRKLTVFGPEGFREVPKEHRLVMTMGNNANEFFNAVNEALGSISETKIDQLNKTFNDELFKALSDLLKEKQRLTDLKDDIQGEAQ